MTILTFEQHEANIKALKDAADDAYGIYDRAERRAPCESPELGQMWANAQRAQDAYQAALRAKEERRKAFAKLLRG